jgi:hypothetical protein
VVAGVEACRRPSRDERTDYWAGQGRNPPEFGDESRACPAPLGLPPRR